MSCHEPRLRVPGLLHCPLYLSVAWEPLDFHGIRQDMHVAPHQRPPSSHVLRRFPLFAVRAQYLPKTAPTASAILLLALEKPQEIGRRTRLRVLLLPSYSSMRHMDVGERSTLQHVTQPLRARTQAPVNSPSMTFAGPAVCATIPGALIADTT